MIERKVPDATSADLHLSHPTYEENISIWKFTSTSWKDALTPSQYLEESAYLMNIPLAADGGMTQWVLVDKTVPQGHRRTILASCETFRKRSLISDSKGNVTDTITHGIASVYTHPNYRCRGYASRLMKELSKVLPGWQADKSKRVVASVLFSDIGKETYARMGWHPFPSFHVEFDSVAGSYVGAAPVGAQHLGALCARDEALSRRAMARPHLDERVRFMILPDHDHMLWHHRKEEFACTELFGKQPLNKGAIAGKPGNQVWAIWTHRYYGSPDDEISNNTLYILRLVIENQARPKKPSTVREPNSGKKQPNLPVKELKAVLRAAQAEAAQWRLPRVTLWGPSPRVEELIHQTGIQHRKEERDEEGICSLQWYLKGSGKEDSLDWVGNEKYGWC